MTSIRFATAADLRALGEIERAADALFEGVEWGDPPSGEERAAEPGFVLVAVADGSAVGFVHVIERDGRTHLEQLSVHPSAARRGLGRALVRAALAEAERRGTRTITLRTYADVLWNAPFYATCGFAIAAPADEFSRRIEQTERRLGLERHGRRVWMSTRVGTADPRHEDGDPDDSRGLAPDRS